MSSIYVSNINILYISISLSVSLCYFADCAYALRDVRVQVPHAVRRGERALLKCFYDIEDDSLYSVKWYRGVQEFYRYMPKESPAMKIFQFASLKVDRYASNESQIVLEAVTMFVSGKYSCEVSADAPSFHTLIATAELEVVETPHNSPVISGIRSRYNIGDILRGNCTSRHSRPAANLTWAVNNREVNPSHVRHFRIMRDGRNGLETSIIGIHFAITTKHLESGKLKLRCTAQIYDIYWKFTEKTILEDHHKHAATDTVNMVHNEPYDQYALQDSELLHKKDTYLTQIQEFLFHFVPNGDDTSSLNASGSGSHTLHSLRAKYLPFAVAVLLLGWTMKELLLQLLLLQDATNNQNDAKGNKSAPLASAHLKVAASTATQSSSCGTSGCHLTASGCRRFATTKLGNCRQQLNFAT